MMNGEWMTIIPHNLYPCHLHHLHLQITSHFLQSFPITFYFKQHYPPPPHVTVGKDDNSRKISQVLHSFQTSSMVSSDKSHFVFTTFQDIKSLKMWNIIFFSDRHCSVNEVKSTMEDTVGLSSSDRSCKKNCYFQTLDIFLKLKIASSPN